MISFIFSGYLSSIGKVLKNICRQIAIFRGPISNLKEYCDSWNLKINIEKTKIIIFNKSGKLLKNYRFYINDVQLENAQEYKYLGILMRASGTFTNAIQYLSNKALKVIFMIRRRFQTEVINAKLFLKLFDTCVKPILLYGSELWSVFNINLL